MDIGAFTKISPRICNFLSDDPIVCCGYCVLCSNIFFMLFNIWATDFLDIIMILSCSKMKIPLLCQEILYFWQQGSYEQASLNNFAVLVNPAWKFVIFDTFDHSAMYGLLRGKIWLPTLYWWNVISSFLSFLRLN